VVTYSFAALMTAQVLIPFIRNIRKSPRKAPNNPTGPIEDSSLVYIIPPNKDMLIKTAALVQNIDK
jgi:hypothetical protein